MRIFLCFLLTCMAGIGLGAQAARAEPRIDLTLDIARVWAGHPVGFCLLTHPPYQFVGFYDTERRMTVASRRLEESEWQFQILPESVRWDSHNAIEMAIDDTGHLHLAGNMHCHPLKYFRTAQPFDITSFERIPSMVGTEEARVTYPNFFRGPDNTFLFTYRDGGSGDGNQIFNAYAQNTQQWRRLMDQPLTDGEGQRNAYFEGPRPGPDGYWHLLWVWRETPDCATNHDPSYARSKDLIHWEKGDGTPLSLPITLAEGDIIDPIPTGGGIINGNLRLGFDAENRPIATYHKFDEKGLTQLYNARLENGSWKIFQSSQWDYRWEFSGGGTIIFEIRVEGVRLESDGTLSQGWSHPKEGRQRWRLDPETLQPIERLPEPPRAWPKELDAVTSDFPGMQVRWAGDKGRSGDPGVQYRLRWETLGANRDRPREKPWPEPSILRLYRLAK